MTNLSDFDQIPKRGRLLEGNGLKGNEVDYTVNARQHMEPFDSTKYLFDAGVLGGLGDDACKRFCTLCSFLTWVSCKL